MKTKNPSPKLLDIIIPARNEEGNLHKSVSSLIAAIEPEFSSTYRIILVNDNSTDETKKEITKLQKEFKKVSFLAVTRTSNPGFGNAVRDGLKNVEAEYFTLIMADASDDPDDLRKIMHIIRNNRVDAVFTNRFKKGGNALDYPFFKKLANRIANLTIALLYTTKFTDLSNAFKVIRSSLIKDKQITSENFELTAELALTALTSGRIFREIPITWHGRTKGVSKFKLLRSGLRYGKQILRFLPKRYLGTH